MAVPIPGTQPRVIGGQTASQRAAGFVNVQTSGARELARDLLRAASKMGADATKPLTDAAVAAARPIMEAYKSQINDVTGNLRRSVRVQPGKRKYAGVGIAVGGPIHVVNSDEWDVEKRGAGNHAFLAEFGTGRRRPATQGRRTYLNVHEKINTRFTRVPNGGRPFDNEQFERMGQGRYFIMGSKNTRGRKHGSGYPHDFIMALAPGQTYGAMPARHWMENAIQQAGPAALKTLMAALQGQIDKLQRAA